MKINWKTEFPAVSLVLMLLFSLMPSIASSAAVELPVMDAQSSGVKESGVHIQTGPSSCDRVLIGYTGCPGVSYGLLFYDYTENQFFIYWRLEYSKLVEECECEGGKAAYYIWLRITDNRGYGDVIVSKKWKKDLNYISVPIGVDVGDGGVSKPAGSIVWPLKWELTCIAAGTHKSDFWDKVDEVLDTISTVLTIIAIAEIIAVAVASAAISGGSTTPIATVIATEAAIALVKISYELFKSYVKSEIEDEIIAWLKAKGIDPGKKGNWATILLGVVNDNVSMESEAEIELSGPQYVNDTYDVHEQQHGPYELKKYKVSCTAKRFNKINLTFSTPEEVQDPVNPLIKHPGSKINSFNTRGVLSHTPSKEDHALSYVWDFGSETLSFVHRCLNYLWHDKHGNPYWILEFIIEIDAERLPSAQPTIVQDYLAEIELFGIDYYKNGHSKSESDSKSVNVEFDYTAPVEYFIDTCFDILDPDQYAIIIELPEKYIIMPIIAYPPEEFPDFFLVSIPDLGKRQEVVLIVPKMTTTDSIIILRNGTLGPNDNVIFMHEHPLFFQEGYFSNSRIRINLKLFGEEGNIVIRKPGIIEQLPITFQNPFEYYVILPEMPIPPEGLALRVNNPDNAFVIKTPLYTPWNNLTISMPYPAKTTYVQIPSGDQVEIKLLKSRTPITPPPTDYYSLGLYTEVSIDKTHVKMYAGCTGLTPFATATLWKPEGEPPNLSLYDSHSENPHGLYVTSNSSVPSISLYNSTVLFTVELTAYINLYPRPYIPPISTKPNKDTISSNLMIGSNETVEFINSNVSISEDVTITLIDNGKLVFNNTNIIGEYLADGGIITIQATDNGSVKFVDSQIHKIVGEGITDYYFNMEISGNATLKFSNSSTITKGSSLDTIRLSDNSLACTYTSLLYWNDEGQIICRNSSELHSSLSYISTVLCHDNSTLSACLGSRILYLHSLDESQLRAKDLPDLWYVNLTQNSNLTVYDTAFTREVIIKDSAHLTLTENSTLCGTHISDTKPVNWTINGPTTQIVWGFQSKIRRQHRLWTTYLNGTVWPQLDVIFYDESLSEVFRTKTDAIGYVSVILLYIEANSSATLIAIPGQSFNMNSKGPIHITILHDIAVTSTTAYPTSVTQGETVTITVEIENEGAFLESFSVTAYYDNIAINSQPVTNLWPKASQTLDFDWDTTGVGGGTYTIKAVASIIPDETDTTDNTYIDGTVYIEESLSVSISPDSVTMDVGQSQEFTSTVTGGTSPYTYQWYKDDTAVSGATSSSWTFTPGSSGDYSIYVEVTDNVGATVDSNTATVTVNQPQPQPGVGGVIVPIDKLGLLAPYIGITSTILVAAVAATMYVKRGRRRKEK